MRASMPVPILEPTENHGQDLQSIGTEPKTQANQANLADRTVRRINGERISFRDLAMFAWPRKTEQNLSFLTGYDARTCRRWLTHRTEPPAEALGVVLAEIMKLYQGK